MKWLGAILVIVGSSGWGILLAANHQNEERQLRHLLDGFSLLERELRFRMWPLSMLFCQVAEKAEGEMVSIFRDLGAALQQQEDANGGMCMDKVLARHSDLSPITRAILASFGRSLGAYDLDGQLKQIECCKKEALEALDRHCEGKQARLRCYRTIGICAGCALALLLM